MATSTEFLRYRTGEALMAWPPVQRVKKLCIASGAAANFRAGEFRTDFSFFACFKPFGQLFGSWTIKGTYSIDKCLRRAFFGFGRSGSCRALNFGGHSRDRSVFHPMKNSDRKSGLRSPDLRRRVVVSGHSVAADLSAKYFSWKNLPLYCSGVGKNNGMKARPKNVSIIDCL